MYLYNSLTHKKELFVPNDPDLVKMYTCGPTVYHYAHIGNLRTYIMEDVLEKSGALELPKHSTLMHPNDYTTLQNLHCVYEGRLSGLPQRQNMDFGGDETVVSVYLGLALGLVKAGVRQIF